MLKLFALLAAFLTLGVGPDDPDPPDDPAGTVADPPADDNPDDVPDPLADDPPADPPTQLADDDTDDPVLLKERLRVEKEARAKSEREYREATERAAAERSRAAAPPQHVAPSQDQQIFEAEEARLRDPAITEGERWTINANRSMRASNRAANEALRNSIDISDKAEFDRACAETPAIKKYAERVEAKLAEVRKAGNNMARMAIVRFLIGDDAVSGKLKSKTAKPAPATRVERGAAPSMRSDVRTRGGMNDRQKRAQRLEGKAI
jgi:hypothetical protein